MCVCCVRPRSTPIIIIVSVCYVAVPTIVLSRHGCFVCRGLKKLCTNMCLQSRHMFHVLLSVVVYTFVLTFARDLSIYL